MQLSTNVFISNEMVYEKNLPRTVDSVKIDLKLVLVPVYVMIHRFSLILVDLFEIQTDLIEFVHKPFVIWK